MDKMLRWESPTRYYCARLTLDLLGAWVVERCWGGKYNRLGHIETLVMASHDDGLRFLDALHVERVKHRYRLVGQL